TDPRPFCPTPARSESPGRRGSCRRGVRTATRRLRGLDASRVAPVLRRGVGGRALRVARGAPALARPLEKTKLIRGPDDDINEPANERRTQEQVSGPLGKR